MKLPKLVAKRDIIMLKIKNYSKDNNEMMCLLNKSINIYKIICVPSGAKL